MRRTRDDAEATRESLLDAALIVFSRQGYEATRLEDIAEEAKVTRGAIYHHFGGKAQLFQALTRERFAAANAALGRALSSGGAPLNALHTLMLESFDLLARDPQYRAMQEIILFHTPLTPELAEGLAAKRDGARALADALADLIRQGIAQGDVRPSVEPADAAVAAIGLLNGVMAMWLFDPEGFSLSSRAAGIVDVFVDGLRS
ncbi:MAG: TetR family transcriptional regulator [Anaerolineae bacterium]|nr:TetR family transcriptional regulator [Anaerolineae bacterium]NUQ05901.1 TetR family transcriptional regulator [Anaerolineae bacterium]